MARYDWKIVPDTSVKPIERVPFSDCRKFFAADNSGSTHGAISRSERDFVDYLRTAPFANQHDTISLWGSRCSEPTSDFNSVRWTCDEGTYPTEILRRDGAVRKIKEADVWYLLTDGEVFGHDVQQLASLAQEVEILSVPVVFVIVGKRFHEPQSTNISVGISFFTGALNALILFKDVQSCQIFVIAAKGCFAELGGGEAAQDLSSWTNIPVHKDEAAFFKHSKTIDIMVPRADNREDLPRGTSLGAEWEQVNGGTVWVDLDRLIRGGVLPDDELFNLLADEAFNNLAVAYKIRRRVPELRTFVLGQKKEQIVPKLEDKFGASDIIAKMADPALSHEQRKSLQTELRVVHVKNTEYFQQELANNSNSAEAQLLKKRNQLVDAALRTLASIEAAAFNAEILARRSNRARRAEVVSETAIPMASLDLEGPACRGYCLVCCGDDEIMSICLTELPAEHRDDNTTDFALNFPLAAGASEKNTAMVSSQNICFQCALWSPEGLSIYKEPLKAVIPTVQFEGANKTYIHTQLYLALTDGLATGAAGISQLFMAMLDEVLRTKAWAGAGLDQSRASADERNEAVQRRRTFSWTLDQLVQNTWTRETFSELGGWVAFPQALKWVARDFADRGLASFAVTYPVAGFDKLLSLGKKTGSFDEDAIAKLGISKAVYSVAAKYLADWQKAIQNRDTTQLWKQPYLSALYASFNAPLVPRDLGTVSLVTFPADFISRLKPALTMSHFHTLTPTVQHTTMHRIQALLFWLLYRQNGHCTAQTFFSSTALTQPLAPAVLNAALPVPEHDIHTLLLSIFASAVGQPIDPTAAALHNTATIPFASPFGPSVLRCGAASCGVRFYDGELDPDTIDAAAVTRIRNARAMHLVHAYGLRGFEDSVTGMPVRTIRGKAPVSRHMNVHASIVEAWRYATVEQRRAFIDDTDGTGERRVFVKEVMGRVCKGLRGDVGFAGMEESVRGILPSFFEALEKAVRMERGEGEGEGRVEEFDVGTVGRGVLEKAKFELAK